MSNKVPHTYISGQHLISAIFEKRHNIPTTSWWMAESEHAAIPGSSSKVGVSSIELDKSDVPEAILQQVEDECNEAIRDHLDVQVKMFQLDDPELKEVHGDLEVMEINGLFFY